MSYKCESNKTEKCDRAQVTWVEDGKGQLYETLLLQKKRAPGVVFPQGQGDKGFRSFSSHLELTSFFSTSGVGSA